MSVYKAIEQLAPGKHFYLPDPGTYQDLQWRDTGNPPTEIQVNAILASVILVENKKARVSIVDKKTRKLISAGFTYGGQNFSLSSDAQKNWLAIHALSSLLTFPVKVTTQDNAEYSLSSANADAFVSASIAAVQGHLDSGRTLKVSINAATTESALSAIVDNR